MYRDTIIKYIYIYIYIYIHRERINKSITLKCGIYVSVYICIYLFYIYIYIYIYIYTARLYCCITLLYSIQLYIYIYIYIYIFQAVAVSVLLFECTTWTLTKRLENKIDGSCTRMLRAALNKSWKQHPTKKQLYGHLPPIIQTIRERRTRHAGHCWRSSDELISDILLWAPTHEHTRLGRLTKTYIE